MEGVGGGSGLFVGGRPKRVRQPRRRRQQPILFPFVVTPPRSSLELRWTAGLRRQRKAPLRSCEVGRCAGRLMILVLLVASAFSACNMGPLQWAISACMFGPRQYIYPMAIRRNRSTCGCAAMRKGRAVFTATLCSDVSAVGVWPRGRATRVSTRGSGPGASKLDMVRTWTRRETAPSGRTGGDPCSSAASTATTRDATPCLHRPRLPHPLCPTARNDPWDQHLRRPRRRQRRGQPLQVGIWGGRKGTMEGCGCWGGRLAPRGGKYGRGKSGQQEGRSGEWRRDGRETMSRGGEGVVWGSGARQRRRGG